MNQFFFECVAGSEVNWEVTLRENSPGSKKINFSKMPFKPATQNTFSSKLFVNHTLLTTQSHSY